MKIICLLILFLSGCSIGTVQLDINKSGQQTENKKTFKQENPVKVDTKASVPVSAI